MAMKKATAKKPAAKKAAKKVAAKKAPAKKVAKAKAAPAKKVAAKKPATKKVAAKKVAKKAVAKKAPAAAVYDQDVFVNVVGGIRVQETAADLPILFAILSSFRDRALPDKLVAFGEVGLSGEIRPVPNGEERLKEAATHGFLKAVVPKANAPKKTKIGEMEVVGVERLGDALNAIL